MAESFLHVFKGSAMTKKEAQENQSKTDVVMRIALDSGALEHCEEHDVYYDPMDDEALAKAQGRARELVEAKESTVAVFKGNAEELIELLDDIVADAQESCAACDEEGKEEP
jgi:hypothetical protein